MGWYWSEVGKETDIILYVVKTARAQGSTLLGGKKLKGEKGPIPVLAQVPSCTKT